MSRFTLLTALILVSGCNITPAPLHPIIEGTLERAEFYCPGIEYNAEISQKAIVVVQAALDEGRGFLDLWNLDPDLRMERFIYREFNRDLGEELDELYLQFRNGVSTWDTENCPTHLWGAVVVGANSLWLDYGDQLHIVMGVNNVTYSD